MATAILYQPGIASAYLLLCGVALDNRRKLFSQEKVRSTLHRLGKASNLGLICFEMSILTLKVASIKRLKVPQYPSLAQPALIDGYALRLQKRNTCLLYHEYLTHECGQQRGYFPLYQSRYGAYVLSFFL